MNRLGSRVVVCYLNNFGKTLTGYQTPFCFSLKINPSCHTLSKGLEMSKNTARTSRDLGFSKARRILLQDIKVGLLENHLDENPIDFWLRWKACEKIAVFFNFV